MNAALNLFRPAHAMKFVAVTRRDGFREAFRRARHYAGLILRNKGRTEFSAPPAAPASHEFRPFWDVAAREDAFHLSAAPALLSRRRRIAVIGDLNLPQCRKYRVEQLQELWATRDVEVEFSHYEDFPRAADIMQRATHLLLYRLASGPKTENYLYEARRLRLPVAYDIDDPLFSVSAYATYGNAQHIGAGLRAHFLAQAPAYAAAMNACDVVSVSTPELRRHAELYTHRPVFVRRNFADIETLEAGRRAAARASRQAAGNWAFTVAFASGSQGREADFDTVAEELERFVCATPDRRLMILGQFPASHLSPQLAVRTITAPFKDYAQYLGTLAAADCTVIPLADDIFNRCKSGVRFIDAAAVAVPALVPGVGDAGNLIVNGQSGIVLPGSASWSDALETLAADRASARDMGQRARRHLEANWSAALRAPIIDEAFQDWVLA